MLFVVVHGDSWISELEADSLALALVSSEAEDVTRLGAGAALVCLRTGHVLAQTTAHGGVASWTLTEMGREVVALASDSPVPPMLGVDAA